MLCIVVARRQFEQSTRNKRLLSRDRVLYRLDEISRLEGVHSGDATGRARNTSPTLLQSRF